MTHIEELIARLVEKVEHRYWGKYRAVVVDNSDPEFRGRLKLQVPAILGADVVTGWALPSMPYGGTPGKGLLLIPEAKATVWAEFEGGLLEYPVWTGCWWAAPGGASEAPKPLDSQQPPTCKVIETEKHRVEIEDGSEAGIKILDNANKNTVAIDKNGIAIEDANSNKIDLTQSGINIENKSGHKVTIDSSGITIEGTAIKLGQGAAEPVIKGQTLAGMLDALVGLLQSHTHVGNLGAPTGPPMAPLTQAWSTALSQKSKVE